MFLRPVPRAATSVPESLSRYSAPHPWGLPSERLSPSWGGKEWVRSPGAEVWGASMLQDPKEAPRQPAPLHAHVSAGTSLSRLCPGAGGHNVNWLQRKGLQSPAPVPPWQAACSPASVSRGLGWPWGQRGGYAGPYGDQRMVRIGEALQQAAEGADIPSKPSASIKPGEQRCRAAGRSVPFLLLMARQ